MRDGGGCDRGQSQLAEISRTEEKEMMTAVPGREWRLYVGDPNPGKVNEHFCLCQAHGPVGWSPWSMIQFHASLQRPQKPFRVSL